MWPNYIFDDRWGPHGAEGLRVGERCEPVKVDRSHVEHVASLARIALSEKEKDLYTGQLSAILEFFDTLKEVDTTGVAPTSHVLEMANVVREDRTALSLTMEDALRNAPDPSGPFFRVPRILD